MPKKTIKYSHNSLLKNNMWLLKKIWQYTPGYVLGVIAEGIIWGSYNCVTVLYTKKLFDALEQQTEFWGVAQVIFYFAVYMLLFYVFHHWYWDIFNPKAREKLHVALHSDIFKQAVLIDLEKYDDPKFYNDFIWAMDQSYNHAVLLVEDIGKLINRIFSSFVLVGILFSVDGTIAIFIFLLATMRVALTFLMNQTRLEYLKKLNYFLRKDEYVKRVFRLPDYAKELRVTQVKKPLFKEYNSNIDEQKRIVSAYGNKLGGLKSLISAVSIIGENLLIVFILHKIMVSNTLSLSGFAVAINASWKMNWLLADSVERLMKYHEHGIFIEKMLSFLSCEPKIKDGEKEAPPFEEFVVKNLKFGYGSKHKKKSVLDHLDMRIRKGEKIAIVGYNGAGKTTLTKLLMRLYDPDEGEILYNGENIKNYTISSFRKHIAAVFQDYRLFACSIAENVVGGTYAGNDQKKIVEALEKSTFDNKLKSMGQGIFTRLTREFDNFGTQLSGGEQQKVAIARAFYKNADIVILDEPSSALDPDAEYALNQAISEYAEDKTVIFISHRLSTTKNVDRIYMFEKGRIIEQGTHEQLMKMNGKYAYMFKLQAEKYQASDIGLTEKTICS